jgi:hypothetical protein
VRRGGVTLEAVPLGRVQVTFDCADPDSLASFWAEVLRYPPPDFAERDRKMRAAGFPEDQLESMVSISDPTGAGPRVFFQRVPEPKVVKNRVHLDVGVSADGHGTKELIDAEVARVVDLGGRVLHPVSDDAGYFVVMQDPEGNEFCID